MHTLRQHSLEQSHERSQVPEQPRPTRRGGKSAEQALATRATLIDLAVELFSQQGYIQTSIRDLAHRSKMTSGAIYGHFRNKADLLAAAVNQETTVALEARSFAADPDRDHVEVLTRLAREYTKRRRLRALILQGAAAAHTDEETRASLREEQLSHLNEWIAGYERERDRLGIDPSVDMRTAVIYTWAAEVGLGVLEAVGIEPTSGRAWSDVSNRFARSLRLAPEDPTKTVKPPARKRPVRKR